MSGPKKNAHLQKSKMHLPSKDLFSSTKQYQDGGTLPSEWFPFAYLHFESPGGRVGSPRRHMRSGTLNLELTISAEAFQISLRYNGIAIHKVNLYIFPLYPRKTQIVLKVKGQYGLVDHRIHQKKVSAGLRFKFTKQMAGTSCPHWIGADGSVSDPTGGGHSFINSQHVWFVEPDLNMKYIQP